VNTLQVRTAERRDPDTGHRTLVPNVYVDGAAVVDLEERWLGIDLHQLAATLRQDGEHFIITCSCGVPECAGIKVGVKVRSDAKCVHWTVRGVGPTKVFSFPREAYAAAVRLGIAQFKKLLTQSGLEPVPATNASVQNCR
jgi:hypothetical protein